MNISIPADEPSLRGDLILEAVLRSDITPIPETVEATVRWDELLAIYLTEGREIKAGRFDSIYTIIKVSDSSDSQGQQGARLHRTMSFIAILKNCLFLGMPRDSAVVKEITSFGTIYNACNAGLKVASDVPVERFGCLVGEIPSIPIARALQEEKTTVFWSGEEINFLRNEDLFKQDPVQEFPEHLAIETKARVNERYEIPSFYSDSDDSSIIWGDKQTRRQTMFIPKTSSRVLFNMTQVIVNTKTVKTYYAPHLLAGNVVDVSGDPYVIMTAAHSFSHTKKNTFSKLWLGVLR